MLITYILGRRVSPWGLLRDLPRCRARLLHARPFRFLTARARATAGVLPEAVTRPGTAAGAGPASAIRHPDGRCLRWHGRLRWQGSRQGQGNDEYEHGSSPLLRSCAEASLRSCAEASLRSCAEASPAKPGVADVPPARVNDARAVVRLGCVVIRRRAVVGRLDVVAWQRRVVGRPVARVANWPQGLLPGASC